VIDLHMHTTASDGRCTPAQLLDELELVGLEVISVTDHDTVASTPEVQALAAARGIEAVPGIEITAVENQKDVHILGYFCDIHHAPLLEFLARGREQRLGRMHAIAGKLAEHGAPIDVEPLLRMAAHGKSIGRPQIAAALIEGGHVADLREAFDKWLAGGRPAFVPRTGSSAATVIGVIHDAGGVASLAHPGLTRIDDRIPELRDAGLDALEVYHSGHDEDAVERYRGLADRLGMLVTGGSDYHGDPAMGRPLGGVTLPEADFERLRAACQPHA